MTRRSAIFLWVLATAAGCVGKSNQRPEPPPFVDAEAWPSADRLFRSDSRWLGGDGAYSIGLGDDRVLWLFGDSFIRETGEGGRDGSVMVRNSVGIQEGLDPSGARMRFHWGGEKGRPEAFFAADPDEWLWPGHGARLGRGLLVFMLRVRAKGTGVFGFEPFGWTAFHVEDAGEPPSRWRPRRLNAPAGGPGLCSGAVLEWEGHVYGYCPSEPEHGVFLARWEAEKAAAGNLSAPQWWNGSGWGAPSEAAPAFTAGQTEFTVHYDALLRSFVEAQSAGLAGAELILRFAPRPEGPWSRPMPAYRPPESARKDAFIYAGKAHPRLSGGDLALTYASNAWDFKVLVDDRSLYYPRFVRLRRATAASRP